MKKLISIILSTMMIFSLTACDSDKEDNENIENKLVLNDEVIFNDITIPISKDWKKFGDSYTNFSCKDDSGFLMLNSQSFDDNDSLMDDFDSRCKTYSDYSENEYNTINVSDININVYEYKTGNKANKAYIFTYNTRMYDIDFLVNIEEKDNCNMYKNSDDIIKGIKFYDESQFNSNTEDNNSLNVDFNTEITFKNISYRVNSYWDIQHDENFETIILSDKKSGISIIGSEEDDGSTISDSTVLYIVEKMIEKGEFQEKYDFTQIDNNTAIITYNFDDNAPNYHFTDGSIIYTIIFKGDEDSISYKIKDDFLNNIKINEPSNENQEENSNTTETEKINKIGVGMYKVGKDIPAGEYMLFCNTSYSGYICVSTDSNQNDIIFNENFDYNHIATFNDGEYAELTRCVAYPIESVTNDMIDTHNPNGGMFIVGKHIEAGEYKLKTTTKYGGYYCIYSDSRESDIIDNSNFENSSYVTVSDGEYLLLSRCTFDD